jgi:hypothetical protein
MTIYKWGTNKKFNNTRKVTGVTDSRRWQARLQLACHILLSASKNPFTMLVMLNTITGVITTLTVSCLYNKVVLYSYFAYTYILLLWFMNSNIVYCISRVENEIEFSTRGIHDIFPTTTKKNANIRYSFKLQILFDRAADKTYIGGHGYYNCVQWFHCAQARRYLIG